MTMNIAALRSVYIRSLFFLAWFALTVGAMHALAGLGEQTGYPRSSQAAAR